MQHEVGRPAQVEEHSDVVEALVADLDDVGQSPPDHEAELLIELDRQVVVASDPERCRVSIPASVALSMRARVTRLPKPKPRSSGGP